MVSDNTHPLAISQIFILYYSHYILILQCNVNMILILIITVLFLTLKNPICKKIYLGPINKTQRKCYYMQVQKIPAHQKCCVIQPVTRVDSDLSSYDMIERPEERKRACDSRLEERGRCCSGPGEMRMKSIVK